MENQLRPPDEITSRLACKDLYDVFIQNDIGYFCGVPDSLVSSFSLYLEANAKEQHMITSNEGNAIGLAIGYHVATRKVPLVYMQNSGLGNAIDPLVSLADPSVFGIPMILLISWRGQPGIHDEPQHTKQGALTPELLQTLGITYKVLSCKLETAKRQVEKAAKEALKTKKPYALLLEKNTLAEYHYEARSPKNYPLSREEAIGFVISKLDESDVIVSSIGKTSRELFEYRRERQQMHDKDLLIVGGMGHASSIALGIAKQKPDRNVVCLDGDGSVLMHMGSLATIGASQAKNLLHIILNNGLHDSVGGQPTVGFEVDLPAIAKFCGYQQSFSLHHPAMLGDVIESCKSLRGPTMIEIRVHGGAREDLLRPSISPARNKELFMSRLNNQ